MRLCRHLIYLNHGSGFCCFVIVLCLNNIEVHISGQVPTCDSVHSLCLYNAASLGHHATGSMTCYPTQSHYHDHWANQSLPYPNISNNAERQARRQQVSILMSSIWLAQVSNPRAPESNLLSSDFPLSQNGRRALYSFSHPNWVMAPKHWLWCPLDLLSECSLSGSLSV